MVIIVILYFKEIFSAYHVIRVKLVRVLVEKCKYIKWWNRFLVITSNKNREGQEYISTYEYTSKSEIITKNSARSRRLSKLLTYVWNGTRFWQQWFAYFHSLFRKCITFFVNDAYTFHIDEITIWFRLNKWMVYVFFLYRFFFCENWGNMYITLDIIFLQK